VYQGDLWFEKALTDSLVGATQLVLSLREGQLITLLSQGLKNKEIASELQISEGTVKVYLFHLFQKVGVKDRFELALYGLKNLAAGQGKPSQLHGFPTPILRSLVLDRPVRPGENLSVVAPRWAARPSPSELMLGPDLSPPLPNERIRRH
jgi:DNA-binding CsgD family transcriptional regulator